MFLLANIKKNRRTEDALGELNKSKGLNFTIVNLTANEMLVSVLNLVG